MKGLLIVCAFSSLSLSLSAQCNKNVVFTSGRADFVDSLGNSLNSKEAKITVTLTKKDFVLMHDDNEEDALRGDIKNIACAWKDPYKNGKTTFESELTEKSGEKSVAIVTIEGKDGHLLVELKFKAGDKILKIIPTSYIEAKE